MYNICRCRYICVGTNIDVYVFATTRLVAGIGAAAGSVPGVGVTAALPADPALFPLRMLKSAEHSSAGVGQALARCRDLCLFRISRATAHLPQRFYHFLRILQLLRDEVPNPWGFPLLQAPAQTVPHPDHAELSCLRADLLVIFLNGCLIRNIT